MPVSTHAGLLPNEALGQTLVCIFGQYLWKSIIAEQPDDTTVKPQWHTQTPYPLRPRVLWRLWQDPNALVGVRFGHTTTYGLIDIDAGGRYCSADGVADIRAALETIGITRTLLVRSSWSGGLHLYIPLPEAVSTFNLAVSLKACLKAQGISLQAGQVESFPNVKTFGLSICVEYNGHRLPLQPGSGSCQLDDDLNPIPSSLSQFFWQWEQSAPQQDLEALRQALTIGRDNHRKRPKRKTRLVESWKLDLETEIAEGWSDHGQTNALLKTIACYGRVFEGLDGVALVEYVHRIAISRPGYETYCGHQAEILRRCQAWARAVEHFYWPLGTTPTRESRRESGQACAINQQRAEDAQNRIQWAIAELRTLQTLPAAITARAQAIAQLAHVSLQTLYKYLGLWHPDHPDSDEGCERPAKSTDSLDSTPTCEVSSESLKPSDDKALHAMEISMKCSSPADGEAGSEWPPFSSGRGVRGDEHGFPQAESPLPIPLAEVQALIQKQVQGSGWTAEKVLGFVASHFGGRSRGQLLDEELPTLLYHLRAEALKPLGMGHRRAMTLFDDREARRSDEENPQS